MMPRWCHGDCGRAGALWHITVLLLLSASHSLSSPFSPPSSLLLAGPRRLRLGTQPGTVPPSSGALCLCQRPPAILCLPLGWRLCPRLVLERKAFPIPPCSVGCRVVHGAGGCRGGRGWVPLSSGAVPGSRACWEGALGGGGTAGVGRGAEQDVKGQSSQHRQDAWLVPKQPWHAVLAELTAGRHSGPQPWGFGGTASWSMSFLAPFVPSTVLDLPLHWPQRWPWYQECPQGLAWWHFAPARFPPPLSVLSVGAGINPSRLHLPSLGLARVKRMMPRQPPLAPSLLQLRFGFGARPAPGWRGRPCCAVVPARHFPHRGILPSLCHVLCPSIMSLQRVLCPYSVSLPRVPAACPMSSQHAWCPCIPARGWHGCPLSGLQFGSLTPPGLPKVAVMNVLPGHCGFMSAPSHGRVLVVSAAPSPQGSPGAAGKLGTCARRAWGLQRVAVAARHVAPWPGSPAPSSPRDMGRGQDGAGGAGDRDHPTSHCPTGQDGGADSSRGGLV